MRTSATRLACALGVMALATATQAMPPILDHVPTDATFVVAFPSLDRVDTDLQALANAAELPMANMFAIDQMLMMGGMQEAVDTTRSAALFLMPGEMDPERLPIAVLVPVKGFDALVQASFAAKVGDLHVMEVDGDSIYLKDVGEGYAFASPKQELVQTFALNKGDPRAFARQMGATGKKIADEASIMFYGDIQKIRPIADNVIDQMGDDMAANMAQMGMMDAPTDTPLAKWMRERIFEDGKSTVLGLAPTAKGLSLQMSMTFNDGSYLNKVFAEGGDTKRVLNRLPGEPYLLAFAMDAARPAVKKMFMDVADKMQEGAEDGAPNFMVGAWKNASAQGMLIGFTPAAMFGAGFFANTVSYSESDNPTAYLADMKEMIENFDGSNTDGLDLAASYNENATQVGGVSADAWGVKMTPDGSNMMVAQGVAMMYGPAGGPAGFVARTENGVVSTFAKNTLLLGAAMDSANGKGQTFANDVLAKQIARQLPEGRIMEAYVGLGSVMELVGPMLAMMGGVQVDLPAEIPPVGMALGSSDGDAHFGVFVPTAAFKVAGSLGMAFGPMDEEFAGEDDDAGQPRF